MSRIVRVGGAQMGPLQKTDSRSVAVERMLALIERAHDERCQLVVFPELALTTFFPRWWMTDDSEIDQYFEESMPNAETAALFERAKDYGIGFYLGYAELIEEGGLRHRYNTTVLVDGSGKIVGKYRKVHLPGHAEHDPERTFQHLEKKYFEPGNLGFPVWRTMGGVVGMCICNDRRWPETYRVMGLQGVELVVLGYNTPTSNSQRGDESAATRLFHSDLSMQAGAYQNGTWIVGVAKAGDEDGHELMAGSAIINPAGQIVARAETNEDELIVADCDLDACAFYKETVFNFEKHRQPAHYGLIVERKGAIAPP